MSARGAGLSGMNRFDWKWSEADCIADKPVKVFTTFSCGGGSSMGYKRAGFEVLGNVEIDPKMNDIYIANHHPKYNFCEDLRAFNARAEIPEELIGVDILDGSPPCTSFSTAGKREEGWGKEKKFREGQAKQTLDDLFFVFLDTVEKLKPKIVIAENVTGLLGGKARGYVNLIVKRFKELGYSVQIFKLNSAYMDVPQGRERVFFIANRMNYPKLRLDFDYTPIPFEAVRTEHGKPLRDNTQARLLEQVLPTDRKLSQTLARATGEKNKFFGGILVCDTQVAPTITAAGNFYRLCDKTQFTDDDFRNVQTFPQDYDFRGRNVQYVCGMSVPPNMMANIATEIYKQWLS